MFNLQEDLEKNSKLEKVVNLLVFYDRSLNDELHDCTSITLVFRKIRKFISFFDYELIKILAKHLGSDKLKKKFSKYKMSFQEFAKHHICECPSDLFAESESYDPSADTTGKCYIIKTGEEIENLTVKELKTFQRKLNEILGQKFLKVVNVEDGCVQITIRRFTSSVFVISDKQQRALSSLGVLTISCGSESVHIPTLSSLENKAGSGKCIQSLILWELGYTDA